MGGAALVSVIDLMRRKKAKNRGTMKRYIIIVFVALVGLSSCEIEEGTNRTPNLAKKIIARQVVEALYPINAYTRFVIYADALLAGDEDRVKFIKSYSLSAADIVVEESNIVFTIKDRNSSYEYTLTTDGKILSEGGVWTIYASYYPRATFIGVEGVSDCYKVNCTQEFWPFPPADSAIEATLNYNVDINTGHIMVSADVDGRIEEENSYQTKFKTEKDCPLVYTLYHSYDGIYTSGEVDILYRDLVTNKERSVRVTYDETG